MKNGIVDKLSTYAAFKIQCCIGNWFCRGENLTLDYQQ